MVSQKVYSNDQQESSTNRSHRVSKYTCKTIIGRHWHAIRGIMMYRTPEEPTDPLCFAGKQIAFLP